MTDAEWAVIAPLLPPARRGGRRRTTDLREVVNAILYLASSGCQWRMLPKDFPPRSTVQGYFYAWRDTRLLQSINHLLVMTARELEGREVGVLDERKLTVRQAHEETGIAAADFSRIRKAKLDRFTIDRLMAILSGLGQEVEVTVDVHPRKTTRASVELRP